MTTFKRLIALPILSDTDLFFFVKMLSSSPSLYTSNVKWENSDLGLFKFGGSFIKILSKFSIAISNLFLARSTFDSFFILVFVFNFYLPYTFYPKAFLNFNVLIGLSWVNQ